MWGRQNDTHCRTPYSQNVIKCASPVTGLSCHGMSGTCFIPLRQSNGNLKYKHNCSLNQDNQVLNGSRQDLERTLYMEIKYTCLSGKWILDSSLCLGEGRILHHQGAFQLFWLFLISHGARTK